MAPAITTPIQAVPKMAADAMMRAPTVMSWLKTMLMEPWKRPIRHACRADLAVQSFMHGRDVLIVTATHGKMKRRSGTCWKFRGLANVKRLTKNWPAMNCTAPCTCVDATALRSLPVAKSSGWKVEQPSQRLHCHSSTVIHCESCELSVHRVADPMTRQAAGCGVSCCEKCSRAPFSNTRPPEEVVVLAGPSLQVATQPAGRRCRLCCFCTAFGLRLTIQCIRILDAHLW